MVLLLLIFCLSLTAIVLQPLAGAGGTFFFFFFNCFKCLFIFEREGETQNAKQAADSELSAQSPTRGSSSPTARW